MGVVKTVHSIFETIQGEGCNLGKRAVFVRFAGCNLWSGREVDRAKAICKFCDTDFRGGTRYTVNELVAAVCEYTSRFVVLTGGEPGLQVDAALVRAFHRSGLTVAIESNGTVPLPSEIDWICISPKAGTTILQTEADECKLVFPQPMMEPWRALAKINARHYWLSPMDGPLLQENTAAAIEIVTHDPQWRLNIQAHKVWGIA